MHNQSNRNFAERVVERALPAVRFIAGAYLLVIAGFLSLLVTGGRGGSRLQNFLSSSGGCAGLSWARLPGDRKTGRSSPNAGQSSED